MTVTDPLAVVLAVLGLGLLLTAWFLVGDCRRLSRSILSVLVIPELAECDEWSPPCFHDSQLL